MKCKYRNDYECNTFDGLEGKLFDNPAIRQWCEYCQKEQDETRARHRILDLKIDHLDSNLAERLSEPEKTVIFARLLQRIASALENK